MRARSAAVTSMVLVAAGFGACGGDSTEERRDAGGPATTPATGTGHRADTAGTGSRVAAGRAVYAAAGCSACHGRDAKGTDIAPSLPGHSREQVVEQVRAPTGSMPAYSRSQISDDELEAMAAYIGSLEALERHTEPVKLSNLVATHHRMALSATRAGNVADAIHHVDHIIERVKGEHLHKMREARGLLKSGEKHEAEHLIEDMLAGTAEKDLSIEKLHLQLALAAANAKDVKETVQSASS